MFATSTAELVAIGIAAFLTSVLSALAGLGGGLILLALLAQFFPMGTTIPVHGIIQFASNGSRAAFLLRDVDWGAVWRSSILLLPGALLGVVVASAVPEQWSLAVLGLFSLLLAWRPSLLKWRGERFPRNGLIAVGGASGFVNATVGVSGPVISPFFKAATATHVAFVATAGASQVAAHTAKVVAYFIDGWRPVDTLGTVIVGVVGVVAGSWAGTKLMGRFDEQTLGLVFKIVLSALALRLLYRAIA